MFTTIKKVSPLMSTCIGDLFACASQGKAQGTNSTLFVCVMLLIVVLPLDLSQLTFVVFGAITYAALQALQLRPPPKKPRMVSKTSPSYKSADKVSAQYQRPVPHRNSGQRPSLQGTSRSPALAAQPVPKAEVRKPSSQPVSAPIFQGKEWDAEVDELVTQIMPSQEGERVVDTIADFVRQRLRTMIPEVEVIGFASSDVIRGTAFGVAVPEVDIVVNVPPQILASRLQGRAPRGDASSAAADPHKLLKSALRTCTDRLVATGGFKFRRSAFRGDEPKVTLLVPASFGVSSESIPIDFSVNSTTPLYNMALLSESAKKEALAKPLILLVKRWAKDRGVCHGAKGHLSPYQWTLLTIYFLQVGSSSESGKGLLPAVEEFKAVSTLMDTERGPRPQDSQRQLLTIPAAPTAELENTSKTVGSLFKNFIKFYHETFQWQKEAICVRTGKRAPPSLSLPLHIVVNEDTNVSEVAPTIEDPFSPNRNLGAGMTAPTLARLHEEISRAHRLCSDGASLTHLLEPWAPPEAADSGDKDDK